jgi:MFS transporter, SP family, arabinose:H+ symporter
MKNNTDIKVFKWSIIVAPGGFLFGFDTAVVSEIKKQIQELFSLSAIQHGFTIASALIGTVTGALVTGRPADRSEGSSVSVPTYIGENLSYK